ncbi:hypothetical protein [Paraburkholderia sp. BCC1884]|uniref:hypothetical protein n=1 Tax=Paraburkholderia sp. BCC1884 TaxID=2562668 RepID=UPI001181F221|nr:hypothetical protein [Paraburkholderia sp. BCC1884]
MSDHNGDRHPFLDDLTADAVLSSTIMRRSVSGRENIKKLVAAVGSVYETQTPLYLGSLGNRSLLQYEAVLDNGKAIRGVAVVERNEAGGVEHVSVTFSPLDSALSLSARVGSLLERELGEGLFL